MEWFSLNNNNQLTNKQANKQTTTKTNKETKKQRSKEAKKERNNSNNKKKKKKKKKKKNNKNKNTNTNKNKNKHKNKNNSSSNSNSNSQKQGNAPPRGSCVLQENCVETQHMQNAAKFFSAKLQKRKTFIPKNFRLFAIINEQKYRLLQCVSSTEKTPTLVVICYNTHLYRRTSCLFAINNERKYPPPPPPPKPPPVTM